MTNKFALAAVLSALAVPAVAGGFNAGHQMQADLLKLDASQFTTTELAQINAEDTNEDRLERVRLILQNKAEGANPLYTTGSVLGDASDTHEGNASASLSTESVSGFAS